MNTYTSNTEAGKTMLVAGGCFWCVEADMEKLPGVLKAESGYAGGNSTNPTYENYSQDGHREVVKITYNPEIVSYSEIVEYLIKHIDGTDGEGSFYDRGKQYAPAIYFENKEEKIGAEKIITRIENSGVYDKPLAIELLERPVFYKAEEYHQDYYKKNPLKYRYYRAGSGRDSFIKKHWGENIWPESNTAWKNFQKPPDAELRTSLSDIQYKVTQQNKTESAFQNEYHELKEEGIYVDIVSGEPLFSSVDKYNSGTGWPSFTKPIETANIVTKDDWSLFGRRTEVRSFYADSHLGHVFEDGPKEHGGLRYCMNSAALRFIPKAKLATEGYEEYLTLFE